MNTTNVIILKKEGNTNLDKLRIVVLSEAGFDHNNKDSGRKMKHHSGDQSFLAKEQYSTPGKNVWTASLIGNSTLL